MTDIEQGIAQKIVYSAVKPTGSLTLGHYAGAIRNWIDMQDKYRCYYSIADMHSITIDIVPADLRANTLEIAAMYIALGLDPKKCTLYVQSHISAHAELTWVLNCHTQFGEAKRMTQFKDKSSKAPQNVNVGLFDYPVLMAADILLYQADYVPIGQDQKQHVELARTIAERFNNKYSPTFTVPEPISPKHGAKIQSLTNPAVKMSKTDDNENGVIFLLDKPDDIMRKFKRAVTDSDSEIAYSPSAKAGISNLLTIYSIAMGKSVADAEKEFKGANYAAFKESVGGAVIKLLEPVQKRYYEILKDKEGLIAVLKEGAAAASFAARKTLSKVYKKVGFLQ